MGTDLQVERGLGFRRAALAIEHAGQLQVRSGPQQILLREARGVRGAVVRLEGCVGCGEPPGGLLEDGEVCVLDFERSRRQRVSTVTDVPTGLDVGLGAWLTWHVAVTPVSR